MYNYLIISNISLKKYCAKPVKIGEIKGFLKDFGTVQGKYSAKNQQRPWQNPHYA